MWFLFYLLKLCVKNACDCILKVYDSLLSPLRFGGIEQLVVVFLYHLLGNSIVCGIPMLTVLINGIFKREDRVDKAVADSTKLKAGGVKLLVTL